MLYGFFLKKKEAEFSAFVMKSNICPPIKDQIHGFFLATCRDGGKTPLPRILAYYAQIGPGATGSASIPPVSGRGPQFSGSFGVCAPPGRSLCFDHSCSCSSLTAFSKFSRASRSSKRSARNCSRSASACWSFTCRSSIWEESRRVSERGFQATGPRRAMGLHLWEDERIPPFPRAFGPWSFWIPVS